jgi:hypothetical protein
MRPSIYRPGAVDATMTTLVPLTPEPLPLLKAGRTPPKKQKGLCREFLHNPSDTAYELTI